MGLDKGLRMKFAFRSVQGETAAGCWECSKSLLTILETHTVDYKNSLKSTFMHAMNFRALCGANLVT